MSRELPNFDAPPLVETILGVEFAPLPKFSIPHFGLYWQTIKTDYPIFSVQPPLDSQVENVDSKSLKRSSLQIQFLNHPPVRCWFINKTQTELVQLQSDRFIFNWRKSTETDSYPRYDHYTRPAFKREWQRFTEFTQTEKLGDPAIRQCELTYFNHIEKGQGWESFADLPSVFPCWSGKTAMSGLATPEVVDFGIRYLLPDGRGRLRITVQPALRHADQKEVLQVTLSVRGQPKTSCLEDILEWFDFGREWVVRGFADFTSEAMHQRWKRTN